jgi:sigma-B regulation protein RsbU (phosphoserine phosphatase)
MKHSNSKRMKDKPKSPSSGQHSFQSFWGRTTENMTMADLWRQFKSEARAGYGLYSRDVDWAKVQKSRGLGRYWAGAWALFQAMMMKLTPARRVLLLIALFMILANPRIQTDSVTINFARLGGLILFVLLALELADRVTMKRDLAIAREVQRMLLPSQPPEVPGLDLAFAMRPQNTVAGDYYEAIFPFAEDDAAPRLLVAIADVAGKSMPAALLMATFQASLHTMVAAHAPFDQIAHGLNRYASAHSLEGLRFTTAFLAEISVKSRAMRYINAGHNPPILQRSSGAIQRLSEGGVPFGIFADAVYSCTEVVLAAGDRVVMFTDGVAEAENEKGEEYSEGRLLQQMIAAGHERAEETVRRIMASVDAFVGTAQQHDDITCFTVHVSE